MIKKLFITLTLLLCLFPLTAFAIDPGSWDLLNEPCDDFTTVVTWTDGDAGNGVSEISPAGQFHMDAVTGASGTLAKRTTDIGSYPTDGYTFEYKVYHDLLGTFANSDYFAIDCKSATMFFAALLCSDGMFVVDGVAWNEVGTNIVDTGAWTVWRFLVYETDGTVDIYKDGALAAADIDCSYTGTWTDGETRIYQYGTTVAGESHIDYIRAATGLYDPTVSAAVIQPIINEF